MSNVEVLRDKLVDIKQFNVRIMDLMCEDETQDLEKEVDKSSEFERRRKDAIRKVQSQNAPKHVFKSQLQESSGFVPIIKAKLLKIKIATFSGDPKAWQSFWDSFSAAVQLNTAIHDVDKFK